jgi:ATP-binding cassette, subfamily B, multidrug efflux pump
MQTDFGYMEEGKLDKSYDLRLMTRLGTFLRPYWALMALSLLFVLMIAGLDLLVPYLTKETIDRYIVNYAREVVITGRVSDQEQRLLSRYGKDLIRTEESGRLLLPPSVVQAMDRKETVRFQTARILTENRYYLFLPKDQRFDLVLKRHRSFFERGGPYWVISVDQMKQLSKEDVLVIRGSDLSGVLRIALLVLGIMVLTLGLTFFQAYAMELAGQKMVHDLRMKLFSHVQSLSISFFDRNPVGRLVTRLTNDIQNVHEMFTSVLIHLFKDILLLIGIIIILLRLNRDLALISLLVLPLIFVTTLFFSRRARDVFREIRGKVAQMNAFVQENLSGIKIVQLFQREQENGARFRRINQSFYRANMKQISIYALFVPLVEVLSSGAIGLLIWYGGGKVIQERMTLGVLVAFLSYIRMFFQPIRDLAEKYNVQQSAMASLERIFSLFDNRDKIPVPAVPQDAPIRGNVLFEDVSFSYNGTDQILQHVSFSIREGESVAVVGATGAGKTSLLHLLERFYDVEGGRILIDGVDIRERDISRLRSRIGLVMQDTFIFSGDVSENIALAEGEVDERRVREAARLVNAERFIERLPQGYRTQLGEGGEAVLSAGERQLLAFARALYVDPKILVLDEATSHVDPETERLIQEGLGRLLKGRTAIIIAHRLSTIEHADRIIVLHKGQVREIGSHFELILKKGLYYRLYQLQYATSSLTPGTGPV